MPERTLVKGSGEKSCKCFIVPHRVVKITPLSEKIVLLKSTGPDAVCTSIATSEFLSPALHYAWLIFYRQRKKGLGDNVEDEPHPPPKKCG